MNSFKSYLKKEFKEGIRNYKYLVIGISIILFAVADPIMLKMLPKILASQSNMNIPPEMLIDATQSFALQNYLKNLNQLVNIVIVFSLMGIMADEIREKTIVFPYSKGLSNTGMVLGKFVNYGIGIPILLFLGLAINHYYAGILFEGGVGFLDVIKVAGLLAVYFLFNISVIILMSSLSKKGIFAGMSSLGIIFLLPLVGKVFPIKEYLPNYLFEQSNLILATGNIGDSKQVLISIIVILLYIILINGATIFKMNKSESV